MPRRQKSKFEQFFSLNKHFRRRGGSLATKTLLNDNLSKLKNKIIEGDTPTYTYGSKRDINEQFESLRGEFAGQSELLYFHAKLIVLLRRSVSLDENYQRFCELWKTEAPFLLENMNLRWLVSAAETFTDHSDDPLERALALNVSCLVNTVKMAESERYLQSHENAVDDSRRQQSLDAGRVALFDGLSAFKAGTDDTLRNMRWRLDKVSALHPTGKILLECFKRLQQQENLYRRFRMRHTRDKTRWW